MSDLSEPRRASEEIWIGDRSIILKALMTAPSTSASGSSPLSCHPLISYARSLLDNHLLRSVTRREATLPGPMATVNIDNVSEEVDWIIEACLAVSRERAIGRLKGDEHFPMNVTNGEIKVIEEMTGLSLEELVAKGEDIRKENPELYRETFRH